MTRVSSINKQKEYDNLGFLTVYECWWRFRIQNPSSVKYLDNEYATDIDGVQPGYIDNEYLFIKCRLLKKNKFP